MRRLVVLALAATLAACSNGGGSAADPCDAAGIGRAIDDVSASNAAPAKKADDLDDLAANIVQCEASSPTARTDAKDPLNRQLARANLAEGEALAAAGEVAEARLHLDYAAFTAKFVGDGAMGARIAAAIAALKGRPSAGAARAAGAPR